MWISDKGLRRLRMDLGRGSEGTPYRSEVSQCHHAAKPSSALAGCPRLADHPVGGHQPAIATQLGGTSHPLPPSRGAPAALRLPGPAGASVTGPGARGSGGPAEPWHLLSGTGGRGRALLLSSAAESTQRQQSFHSLGPEVSRKLPVFQRHWPERQFIHKVLVI